ncbi:oxidoreductase [Natrialbaceae archaeon A-CW1-1]
MNSTFDLEGQVAIVTGGAGLLGTAVSEGLAEHGATVVVADVADTRGPHLAQQLETDSKYLPVDVTSEDAVGAMVDTVLDEFGRIDTLVNCAYPRNENYGQPYEAVGIDDWRENVDLHLSSYYVPTHAVSDVMRAQDDGGSIINFGSIYGIQAPDFSVYAGTEMTSPVEYSAIKGAIVNFSRYLASYLGSEGVRVNAISPGGVFDDQPSAFVDRYESRTPLGRMAHPDDFKGAVVFLASDASAYVTGHNLRVDGGWTIC